MNTHILDREKMCFAGVCAYSGIQKNKPHRSNPFDELNINFDFLKEDLEGLVKEAKKWTQDGSFGWTFYGPSGKEWKMDFKEATDSFTKTMQEVGDLIGRNSSKYTQHMAQWGQEFGRKMESWGESFEKDVRAYSTDWELMNYYRSLYSAHLENKPFVMDPSHYYEVQLLTTNGQEVRALTMLASRVSSFEEVPYPLTLMQFDPERWIYLTMTQEEYDKDWQKQLSTLPFMSGYTLEDYFIRTHSHQPNDEAIGIFCPLKVNRHE